MTKKALVVIDLQNDITKNYKEIIDTVNQAIDWAAANHMEVVYIRNHYLPERARKFKPGTRGAAFVPELKIVSDHVFTKTRSSALASEEFVAFIQTHNITDFFIAGADATACVKSTCYNMAKAGYAVHVLSDCITSHDTTKLPEMFEYYAAKGCTVNKLSEIMR